MQLNMGGGCLSPWAIDKAEEIMKESGESVEITNLPNDLAPMTFSNAEQIGIARWAVLGTEYWEKYPVEKL